MLKINFDSKYDILYLGLGDRKNSYGDEQDNGIILLKDMKTDILTGITIMDFLKKAKDNGLKQILHQYDIDVKRDILPSIKM